MFFKSVTPLLLLSLIFCLNACGPVPTGSSSGGSSSGPMVRLQPVNMQYDRSIQSVQLYPDDGTPTSQMLPAVVPLNGQNPLLLQFDDLRPNRQDYSVRLVHCEYNWEVSRLSTLEYLYEYNEYPITDFSFSYNTQLQYVHYQFEVPRVKLSGNYLLVVYRNRNPNDVVLSRRFQVFENQVPIQTHLVAAPGGERLRRQQIDLNVLYRNLPGIVDPTTQIKVVIRQNQRWDNAVLNLRPTGDRTASQSLEYQLFDLSNAFPGGNEYRWFDLRTVRALGQNVGRIQLDTVRKSLDAFLQPDKSRGRLAYAQRQDLNGQYVVSNLDFPQDPTISAEYADVHFFLKTDGPLSWPVYVAGEFSNYQKGAPYQMQYDAGLGGYRADVLLKQGWYNYLYLVDNKENALTLEGSFSETENFYEIFVYYRPNTRPTDLLVGYSQLRTGGR
ncbi:type IX secretion system plug protein [Cesiribacter andamanensis]|uniref:Type 9 secretion system plug protein N-terminal domain-containing protein n=1 Tax=Cesiribacter andamanensis AMV16 TaxID=1279009 RepID=M7N8D1_9BACT|nr:type IX secretion system plug protein domain-containing protein [Cesiribacter andamanensis]EMR03471.1 hypothetical protein ADICEAN_01404 [Cesiribacter andamanensis AMV16]